MVVNIATMIVKASNGASAPKKTGDQSQFRIICTTHSDIAALLGAARQMRQPAMAIKT
jgi:hypothetical protein